MSYVPEVPLNKIGISNPLVKDTQKIMPNNQAETKNDNDEGKVPIVELFPWVPEFQTMCKCILENQTMASLTELMQYYLRNVSVSVNECCTKPLKAFRLKETMSETLLLFLYAYRTLPEDQDKPIYLSYMSDILAKYVDMELKASKRSKEDHDKICARLMSCFYIFLGHSAEHLLNTLIKIQLMSRNYHDILHPIITKIMKHVPLHPDSSVMYIRYFLIYRLWRKLNSDITVKNELTTIAIKSLGPPPATFSPQALEEVLPKVPKSQSYCTKSLLQQKFDVKRSCELFIELSRRNRRSVLEDDSKANRIESCMPGVDTSCKPSEFNVDNINSLVLEKNSQESILSLSKSRPSNINNQTNIQPLGIITNNVSDTCAIPKPVKLSKAIPRKRSKISDEILVIDLTSDVVSENIIKRKKSKKLAWLQEVKKRVISKTVKTPSKIKKLSHSDDIINQEDGASSSHHVEDASLFNPTCVTTEPKDTSTDIIFASENADIRPNEPMPTSTNNLKVHNHPVNDTTTLTDDDCATNNRISPILSSLAVTTKTLSESHSSTKSVLHVPHIYNNKESCENESRALLQSNSENKHIPAHALNKSITTGNVSIEDRFQKNSRNPPREVYTEVDMHEARDTQILSQSFNDGEKESLKTVFDSEEKNFSKGGNGTLENDVTLINESTKEYNVHDATGSCIESFSVQGSGETGFSCTAINKSIREDVTEMNENVGSRNDNAVNSDFSFSGVKSEHLDAQVELEVDNYTSKTVNTTHNAITIVEQNQCDIVNNYNNGSYEVREHKRNVDGPVDNDENKSKKSTVKQVAFDNLETNCHEKFNRDSNVIRTHLIKHTSSESIPKTDFLKSTSPTTHGVRDNNYIIHDTELQENIDGLSLLASVSQHVPHLKADSNTTHNQIKVKDYAALRKTSLQVDTNDVNDSLNNISELCKNPSPDVINRIVGIYPEETLDKVALHVEVSSTSDGEHSNVKDETSSTVLRVVDSTVEYDAHVLTNNIISMENSIQPAKDNTNVILNGETVILLQKSPNSNLYIINKAVENAKDDINDIETCGLKEKTWLHSPADDSSAIEVNRTDQNLLNFDIPQYSKEFLGQEYKYSVSRTKGIKVELEENEDEKNINSFAETKAYTKKNSKLVDGVMSTGHHRYQDINSAFVSLDKRKVSAKSNLPCGQGVKEEYINHIASNCGIQAYQAVHPHQQNVIEAQHPLHVPAAHSNNIPSMYNNCSSTADLCVPYHKHCSSVSCNLQMNGGSSLCQHSQNNSNCGRARCSCLDCAYDLVTHCRQYLHSSTEAHTSCMENKSYFSSVHSSVQTSAVQEHEKTSAGTIMSKLYDEQLLGKIEQNLLTAKPLENVETKCDSEKIINKDLDNKLPLKKRLKAHAMMAMVYDKLPKNTANSSYPGMPMMSIAALERVSAIKESQAAKDDFQLAGEKQEVSFQITHFNANIGRNDDCDDRCTSGTPRSNIEQTLRNHDSQYHSGQTSSSALFSQTYHRKTFKTPAQRKQGAVPELASLKRLNVESPTSEIPSKKAKKPSSPSRQTRSSKRNVPKVNYSYTDIDPEWNPSSEAKRKRKKTSR